jgi:hypothetical protein
MVSSHLIIRIFNSRLPGSRKGRKVDFENLFINERNFPYQLMICRAHSGYGSNILQNSSISAGQPILNSLIFLVGLYFSGYFVLAFQPFRNLKAGKAH